MFAYALRRLLQFIPTILVITLIIFLLLNVLPGNAALIWRAGAVSSIMSRVPQSQVSDFHRHTVTRTALRSADRTPDATDSSP